MDLSDISINPHALERFQQRWPITEDSRPKNWEKTLRRLLSHVEEEIKKKSGATVDALLKYKARARYFYNSGWVFVTNEEATLLLTIERKKDRPRMWERPKSKQGRYSSWDNGEV